MLPKRRFKLRSSSKDDENVSDISDISSPELPELQPAKSNKPKKKRNKFTHSQDKEMLKYIMNESRYNEIKGLALWKDMEILQITSHSKQSMKCRFLKTVIPNLHQYDIPKHWVEKLNCLFPGRLNKNPDKENAKTDFTPCSLFDKWRKQSPRLRSSPRIQRNDEKKTAKEKDVTEKVATHPNEPDTSESTLPYMDSPVSRRKRNSYRQSLRFSSSSESESDKEAERNVSGDNAIGSAVSPVPSPSKSAQEPSRRDSSSEQSELSDYDQYLIGIAQKKKTSSKKSSRSGKSSSQSEKASTTSEENVSHSEEEMDQDDAVTILEDRRSRLRHRRHIKKAEKAFGGCSTSPTSSHKKCKNLNPAKFVTDSVPEEEGPNENPEVVSPAKAQEELSKYEAIVSDIAQLYGLTKREVLSTIFSFNGDIEKSHAYIRFGPELSQLKPWSKEEDQIISSTDEKSIKNVARIRGNKLIAMRLQFLENFPDDLIA